MAYFVSDEFPEADLLKIMKMCLIHDLGEAFTGDIPAFEKTDKDSEKEADVLGKWEEQDLYEKMVQKNQGRPMYVLHDGPPYANGEIHLGTALNKVLKDFIIKYKNMSGYCAPYVP